MKLRRRGLVVYLTAETPKDDTMLTHLSKRFNRPMSAGFGLHRITLELPDDAGILKKMLRYIWGDETHFLRFIKSIAATYKEKK